MGTTRSQQQQPDEATLTPDVAPVALSSAGVAQDQVGNAEMNSRLLGGGREDISRYTPAYVEAHRDELGIPSGAPIDDFFNEFVAHTLAYQQMSQLDPNDPTLSDADRDRILAQQQLLESWGYQGTVSEDNEVYDPETGLYAVRFDPNEQGQADGRNSIVAFRGTEPLNTSESSVDNPLGPINDLVADAGPSVGSTQYDPNAEQIRALMAGGQGQVTATGHSLGGYLAQRAASENADLTSEVVTFQAGGLNRGDANRFDQANEDGHIGVRHHYTTADIVHRAGEQRLGGDFFEHRPDELTEGHTKYLMYDDNDVTTISEATGGKRVRQSDTDTVSPWSRHLWEGARTGAGGFVRTGMAGQNAAWEFGTGMGEAVTNAKDGFTDAAWNAGWGLAHGGARAWDGARDGVGQMLGGDVLGGLGTMGGGLWHGATDALGGLGAGALEAGRTGLGFIGDTASAAWDGASSYASDMWTGGTQMARGAWNLAEGAVGAGWEATKAAGRTALDVGQAAGEAAWDGAKWVGGKAAEAGEAAWDGAKWAGNKAVETGTAVGQAAWDGAKWAGNKVADVGSGIADGAKAAWDFATGW